MHVLIIEDDPRLSDLLEQLLVADRHKPFAFEELAARLRSISRRPAAPPLTR